MTRSPARKGRAASAFARSPRRLQKRTVNSGADHAKLQLDRLAPAVQLGAEAIAAGDISAITPLRQGARPARPLPVGRRRPSGL